MDLKEKLARSRSNESIDFSNFQSVNKPDTLVKVLPTEKIDVAPNWTIPNDFEGGMYADYISLHPEYDGIYVRSEVLNKLVAASISLPRGYKLVLRSGHRPIDIQKRLLKECASDYKNDHPGVTDLEALAHARTFVSDPDITLPPHVCGAAVDVEIWDETTDTFLDFGSAMNDDSDKSFLYYPHLTDQQVANRLLLTTAMLTAGFASCKPEWWHFSYGDQVWAWFYGEENSLYSPINL